MSVRPLAVVLLTCLAGCVSSSQKPMSVEGTPRADAALATGFHGVWKGQELDLVITAPRGRAIDPAALFVVIPRGANEGVIHAPAQAVRRTANSARVSANGTWTSARDLTSAAVTLTLDAAGQALDVQWSGGRQARLARLGAVNEALLRRVLVIGHRGASLGRREWMNTLGAVERASTFGADGVELDVTTPYTRVAAGRVPDVNGMRVYHPPEIRAELTGHDTVEGTKIASLPTPAHTFEAIRRSPLQFVYLDMKLRWIAKTSPAALADVLRTIGHTAIASGMSGDASGVTVVVGAELSGPGQTADTLQRLASSDEWTRHRLSWALEITKDTNIARAIRYADTAAYGSVVPPAFLSLNLLQVRGGRGGLLGLFLRDLSADAERAVAATPQPLILWTVHSAAQCDGAIKAAARFQRLGPGTGTRPLGVITPYPHRVIFWLGNSTAVHSNTESPGRHI